MIRRRYLSRNRRARNLVSVFPIVFLATALIPALSAQPTIAAVENPTSSNVDGLPRLVWRGSLKTISTWPRFASHPAKSAEADSATPNAFFPMEESK
jgi:hypothetical protein